jgi:branched-chain amino acid transport system permease protein
MSETLTPLRLLRTAWPVLSLVLLLGIFVAIATAVDDTGFSRTVTEGLIILIVVVGIYIFVGNSGVLAFGHVSFMAVGAYAAAWQTCCPKLKAFTMNGLPDFLLHNTVPSLPAALLSALLAAAFAFAIGAAIMRLSGVAASIGTFATLFIVHVTYSNWESLTRGKGSLVGLPTYVTPAVAFVWAVIAIVAAYLYQESRMGLALRASREDPAAAKAMGVNIYFQRLVAFTLSAFFVGIGGVLHGHFLGTISIDSYFLNMTFMTLAMLVVGGMRSLAGAVVGVVSLSIIIEIFRKLEVGVEFSTTVFAIPAGMQEVVLALAMLIILIFRPKGIMGAKEMPWFLPRRSGGGSTEGGDPASGPARAN